MGSGLAPTGHTQLHPYLIGAAWESTLQRLDAYAAVRVCTRGVRMTAPRVTESGRRQASRAWYVVRYESGSAIGNLRTLRPPGGRQRRTRPVRSTERSHAPRCRPRRAQPAGKSPGSCGLPATFPSHITPLTTTHFPRETASARGAPHHRSLLCRIAPSISLPPRRSVSLPLRPRLHCRGACARDAPRFPPTCCRRHCSASRC